MTPASPVRRPGRAARWLALPAFGLAVGLTAAVGAVAVRDASTEYAGLDQPDWAPPAALFGPVWTALYVTIAIAGWLVWRRTGWHHAFIAYGAQLVLNALWTPLFFGAGRYGLAFLDIVALWLLIGATVVLFGRISRLAAVLLLPYWGWVTFAAALNLSIWRMNA